MSYQYKRADVRVVVCDVCGDFSWIGDRHWHEMPQRNDERPIHLCKVCRPIAIWCPTHQQFHLPDTLHRRTCVDCGGLFTSIVRQQITRCPSCRRAAGDDLIPYTPSNTEHRRSLVQLFFSSRVGHRH